jgi:hypothetical protein
MAEARTDYARAAARNRGCVQEQNHPRTRGFAAALEEASEQREAFTERAGEARAASDRDYSRRNSRR